MSKVSMLREGLGDGPVLNAGVNMEPRARMQRPSQKCDDLCNSVAVNTIDWVGMF